MVGNLFIRHCCPYRISTCIGNPPAPYVLRLGNGLKVNRVHASTYAAEMIQHEAFGHLPVFTFVIDPMRRTHHPTVECLTVPGTRPSPLPNPTHGFIAHVLLEVRNSRKSAPVTSHRAHGLAFRVAVASIGLNSQRSGFPAITSAKLHFAIVSQRPRLTSVSR